jgi:hypothetical protein
MRRVLIAAVVLAAGYALAQEAWMVPRQRRVIAASANWWLAGGVSNGDCLGAYASKGVASLAASYADLNGSTNALTTADAPTWDAETGWTFNGSSNHLILPFKAQNGQRSIVLKFDSGGSVSTEAVFGAYDGTASTRFYLRNSSGGTSRLWGWGNNPSSKVGVMTNGVVALCGATAYKDGDVDEAEVGTSFLLSTTTYIHIGCLAQPGLGSFYSGNITSVAFYNAVLTEAQVEAIGEAMP